ncbi:hypothetical protein [Streptomyces sp. NPDC007172]|uniref:DUF7848 domain-containing protein n=1 Tax=Streptomyces sp. NPDC007172 TaxID=3364776 RepID=UPI003688217B
MSARATARYVRYRVSSHPDGGLSVSVYCLADRCSWSVLPTAEHEKASQEMLHHTADSGHALFSRTVQDMAVVTLADPAEQERRAEANVLEYQHLGGAAEDAGTGS